MKNERRKQRTITGKRKDEVLKWDNIKNEGCRKVRHQFYKDFLFQYVLTIKGVVKYDFLKN